MSAHSQIQLYRLLEVRYVSLDRTGVSIDLLRCTPNWQKTGTSRHDYVLVSRSDGTFTAGKLLYLFTIDFGGAFHDIAYIEQYELADRDPLCRFPRCRRLPAKENMFVFVSEIVRGVLLQPEVRAEEAGSHFLNDILDLDIFYRMESL